jgi:predicted  nucleic acid-binding Zn-ribbon protein
MLSITRPQLELLIELQENEDQVARVQAQIDRMPDKMAAIEAGLKAWTQDLEARKENLAALKKDYRSFEVKQRCGGIGLVQVENAVCKGCYLNIPPQLYNELHRGNELRMCPHCHRLIYVL